MADLSLKLLLLGEDKTASAAVAGLAKKTSSLPNALAGPLAKIGSMIGGEVGEMVSRVSEGFEKMGEESHGLGAKLAVAGGALAGIGAAGALIGSKDKASLAQLKQAIDNTGGSYEDYAEEIEKTIKKQENYGRSAVQTQNALATLTAATNDPKKALEYLGTASDLAAARHIDLGSAADQVAKILNGRGSKTLAMYGIQVDSVKSATTGLTAAQKQHQAAVAGVEKAQRTLTDIEAVDGQRKKLTIGQQIQLRNAEEALRNAHEKLKTSGEAVTKAHERLTLAQKGTTEAVDQLGQKVKGQASAAVDSWGGKLDVLRTKLSDQAAILGQKYGPALTVAGTGLTALGTVLQVVRGRQAAAAVATEAETVATEGQSIASKLAAGAQWLLNAALTANPIGLVVIAIAALVAGFILAYQHSETFRRIVTAGFSMVKSVVMAVVGWIRANWPLLLAVLVGPIGLAVLGIARHWNTIKSGAVDVKNFIVRAWGDLMSFFTGLPGRIARVASGMFDSFKQAFHTALAWIVNAWDSLHFTISIPKLHVPGTNADIGGGSIGFGVPHIGVPALARGGNVVAGGRVIVGDAGPELLDLPAGARVTPLGRGGDTYITLQMGLLYGDADTAARDIASALERVSHNGRPLNLRLANA